MELLYSKLCILHSTLLTRSSPQWTSRFLTPTYAVLAIWCLNHYLSLCLFFIMILMQFCCLVPIVVVTRMYHKISPICWIYSRLIRYSSGSFSSLDSLEKEKKNLHLVSLLLYLHSKAVLTSDGCIVPVRISKNKNTPVFSGSLR